MGSYVLYLLMQAFVALIFAYFSGTLVFKERKLYMLLASLGFYLMMGSALVEVWGDRAGWTAANVGLNAAMVATGVAVIGAGALSREARHMENGQRMNMLVYVFLGIAAVTGVALAVFGGSSTSIVDEAAVLGAEISGAFSHLGPAGWALGSPLFVGGTLLAWMGARMVMVRQDIQGFWFMGAGVLYLLWPFDIWVNDLPLTPTILLMAMTMTYFGLQLPGEGDEEGDVKKDGGKKGDVEQVEDAKDGDGGAEMDDDGPAPWVREAIAAREAKAAEGADEGHGRVGSEDEDEGHEDDDEGAEVDDDRTPPDDDGSETEDEDEGPVDS